MLGSLSFPLSSPSSAPASSSGSPASTFPTSSLRLSLLLLLLANLLLLASSGSSASNTKGKGAALAFLSPTPASPSPLSISLRRSSRIRSYPLVGAAVQAVNNRLTRFGLWSSSFEEMEGGATDTGSSLLKEMEGGASELEANTDGTLHEGKRPKVTVKIAIDRNGAVDDRSMKPARFTCDASLDAVHRLRRDADAVLVGVETVVRDNPSLTVRRVSLEPDQQQPIRVVLDRRLRIPSTSALLNDGHRTILFYVKGQDREEKASELLSNHKSTPVIIECIAAEEEMMELGPDEAAPLLQVLHRLYDLGVKHHVMVEGGPTTARKFITESLADHLVIYQAPIAFEGDPVPSGLNDDLLSRAGLIKLGIYPSGVDMVHCWSKAEVPWPTSILEEWP